jgi:hypothetical protein
MEREIDEYGIRSFFKGMDLYAVNRVAQDGGRILHNVLQTQTLRGLVGKRTPERWLACYDDDRSIFIQNIVNMAKEPESVDGEDEPINDKEFAFKTLVRMDIHSLARVCKARGRVQVRSRKIDFSDLGFTVEQWDWCLEDIKKIKDRVSHMFYPDRFPEPRKPPVPFSNRELARTKFISRGDIMACEPYIPIMHTRIPYYESKEVLLEYLSIYLNTPIKVANFLRNRGFCDMKMRGVLDFRPFFSTIEHDSISFDGNTANVLASGSATLEDIATYMFESIDYRRRLIAWMNKELLLVALHKYIDQYVKFGHLGASREEWNGCMDRLKKISIKNIYELVLGHVEKTRFDVVTHKVMSNLYTYEGVSPFMSVSTRLGYVDISEYRLTRSEIILLREKPRLAPYMTSMLMYRRAKAGLVDPDDDFLAKKLRLPANVIKILNAVSDDEQFQFYRKSRPSEESLSEFFEPHEEWYIYIQKSYCHSLRHALLNTMHQYAFRKFLDNNPVQRGDFINNYIDRWNPVISASVVTGNCGFPERTTNIYSLISEDEFVERMTSMETAKRLGAPDTDAARVAFTFISWNHAKNNTITLADVTDAALPYFLKSRVSAGPDFMIICECPSRVRGELETYGYTVYGSRQHETLGGNRRKFGEEVTIAVREGIEVSYVFLEDRFVTIGFKTSPDGPQIMMTGAHLHVQIAGRTDVYDNFVLTSADPKTPQIYMGDFNQHRLSELDDYSLYDGNLDNRFMDVCYTKNLSGYCAAIPGHPDLERNPHNMLVGQFSVSA